VNRFEVSLEKGIHSFQLWLIDLSLYYRPRNSATLGSHAQDGAKNDPKQAQVKVKPVSDWLLAGQRLAAGLSATGCWPVSDRLVAP
jgi:hypothetical protein